MMTRLKEAQKLGFKRAVVPAAGDLEAGATRIGLHRISHLKELAESVGPCH
jgi:predicted ATP-dependent serine protease